MTVTVSKQQFNARDKFVAATNRTSSYGSQLIQSQSKEAFVLNSGLSAFRNKAINGSFDVWQRGTSATYTQANYGTAGFCADRFNVAASGWTTISITQSKQDFVQGQTDVPGNPTSFLRILCNSLSGSGDFRLAHTIEDVRTFAGSPVVVSFWARCSTGVVPISNSRLLQFFGTGGSSIGNDGRSINYGHNAKITTEWTRFVGVMNLPTVAGKTIGTGNGVGWDLYYVPVAGVSVDIANIQIEEGYYPSAFERRSYDTELKLCQRYCHRIGYDEISYEPYGSGYWQSATRVCANIQYPVTMRAQPTATYGTAASFYVSAGSNNIALTAISTDVLGKNTATIACDVASGGTIGQGSRLFRGAALTNSYIIFSAEL